MQHPEWAKAATIYEVNLRQATPEGTFAAFEAHLPRLKRMGMDILWLMPIHPIGEKNRKGPLGSYYAVRDYLAVNPEFGTLDDFRHLVDAAHAEGFKLIIDWVANHTAWDHAWLAEHPDWYRKNAAGEIDAYAYHNGREVEYWSDVVGLDYEQPALWPAMTEALEWWVRETGIDGYRCDVAGLLPTPFWEHARVKLDAIKPVFMLAEWSEPELHAKAFDMTYAWDLYDALAEVARGRADARRLAAYVDDWRLRWPQDAYRMLFTSNHDKNTWDASDAEVYASVEQFKAFAAVAATLPGMPLVYSGQEAWLDKRLAFFEKDPIDWRDRPLEGFYAGLAKRKHETPALWNGAAGGDIELLCPQHPAVFAFRRTAPSSAVTVIANLSGEVQQVELGGRRESLAPWAWRIDPAA